MLIFVKKMAHPNNSLGAVFPSLGKLAKVEMTTY